MEELGINNSDRYLMDSSLVRHIRAMGYVFSHPPKVTERIQVLFDGDLQPTDTPVLYFVQP